MSVSLPTSIQTEIFSQLKNYAGREGTLYVVDGGQPPDTPSRKPAHKLSHQGKLGTVAPSSAKYKGGLAAAVAAVKTLTVAVQPSPSDTLVVGGKTYTFVASGAMGDQINIGGSLAATATNIQTKIHADTTACLCDASVVGAVVTLTANTAGTDFTVTPSVTSSLVLVVTTPNATGIATDTVKVIGTTFVANTQNEYAIPLVINNIARNMRFVYITQANDTKALIATGLANVLKAGLDAIDPSSNHGFIVGLGPQDTAADLQAAMQAIFGTVSSTAFVASGDTLTCTVGAVGVNGNNVTSTTQIRNSLMNPLILADATTGIPQKEGVREVGKFGKFNPKAPVNFASLQTGNSRSPLDVPTTNVASIDFELYNNADLFALIEGAPNTALSYDTSDTTKAVAMLNAASLANIIQGKMIILVFEDDDGGFAEFVLYKVLLGNFDFLADIGAAGSVKVTGKVQSISGRADQQGYLHKTIAQAA